MKKLIPTLVILLSLLSANDAFAQCYYHDTTVLHWARTVKPYAIAISKHGRLAVTEAYKDSTSKKGYVKIWNDVYDFGGGLRQNDSVLLTSPKGVVFDSADNLYVIQSERADSNIMIYDTGMTLINVINNTAGSTMWTRPRGISIDTFQNIYVVSGNQAATDTTTIPHTGKVIKITDPLHTAVRSLVLSGLDSAMGISVTNDRFYITEYSGNKVSAYDLSTYTRVDTLYALHPLDVATQQCWGFVTERGHNRIDAYNAYDLNDTSVAATFVAPSTSSGAKLGLKLDDQHDLLMCDNKFNRVVIYEGIIPDTPHGLPVIPSGPVTYPLHLLGYMCRSSIEHLFHWGTWTTSDSSIAWVDTNDYVHSDSLPGNVTLRSIVDTQEIFIHLHIEAPISFYPSAIYANTDSGRIYGGASVCVRNTLRLRDDYPGGSWFSSDDQVATVGRYGSVWPRTPGSVSMSYGIINSCGFSGVSFDLNITGKPDNHPIMGDSAVCYNGMTTLSGSGPNGAWSVNDEEIATIDDATGTLHPITPGDVVVTYTIDNGCDFNDTTRTIHIDSFPVAGTVYGTDSVCVNGIISLHDTIGTHGGWWNSSDTSIATVDSLSGAVTGRSEGIAIIHYIVKNSCDSVYAGMAVRVKDKPHGIVITGPDNVCAGLGITLVHTPITMATWSWSGSDNGIALVSPLGSVTGVAGGVATISIIASNSCGMDTVIHNVTVTPQPYSGLISGNDDGCPGNYDLLSVDSSLGGEYWYTSDASIADASSYDVNIGIVSWNSPGTAILTHVAFNDCGTSESYFYVTTNPLPFAGSIVGADSVCFGQSITLTSYGASDPGYWTTSSSAIAGVTGAGVVTGTSIIPASTMISYVVDNSCGTDIATHTVNVKRSPLTGTITGPSAVCHGSYILLSGVQPGGFWASANSSIATVSPAGLVGGASYIPASTNIVYTINTYSCGSASAVHSVSVLSPVDPGFITGADSLCLNSFDTVRNHAATPGGSWRSKRGFVQFITATSGIDTVVFKGIVAGTDTLVYTVHSCGTDSALFTVRVNALPVAGTVVGPSSVCVGADITLSDPTGTPEGLWSTSDVAIASVNPLTGMVTGTGAGSVTIVYSGATACGSLPDMFGLTVDPAPNAVVSSAISGVCVGNTVTLSSAGSYGSGTWSSSNTGVATISATSGIMGGASPGPATITYITVTPTCGADTATLPVVINPLPFVDVITGSDSVCSGATIVLSDVTPGGSWSSVSGSIASVSSGGAVTGLATTLSTTTIRYIVSTAACGSDTATHPITVKPLPNAGTISGPSSVCVGSNVFLTTSASGGTWSSPSANVTVNAATGSVTGVSLGTATVSYTVTNSCGTAYATQSITVTGVPTLAPITGPDSVCMGAPIAETTIPASGTWFLHFGFLSVSSSTSSSINLVATYPGIDTLYYTVSNSCGEAFASKPIKVRALPVVGYILAGADSLCPGNTTTLYNPGGDPGGIWGHAGTNLSVSLSGVVTALFPGSDIVSYTLTNFCGSFAATRLITVNSLPVAGTITGPASVCVSASVSLANTTGTPGGTWACGAGGAVTSSGVFTGTSAGLTTVSYAATTLCGTLYTYHTIMVNPLPVVTAISGPSAVCVGSTATLLDATSGGFWSITPASVATISALSGTYGGVASGGAMVNYSVANSCGTTTVSYPVTVNTLPPVAAILGTATLCPGSTLTLYDGTSGGAWSATNAHASISASGLLTGITTGADTIFYTITNSCGSAFASRVATVLPVPGADTLIGSSVACVGMPVIISSLVPGGVWTATSGHVTVLGGVVTGISTGVDTIHYAETNSCGSATLTKVVTVYTPVVPSVTDAVVPNDTTCGAAPATFTATPVNGGSSPDIVWHIGSSIIGTGITTTYVPANGDVVYSTMASSANCPTAATVTGSAITMHVYPNVIPVVTVTASPSDTVAFIGETITFSADLANCGSSPVYQWYQNGSAISGATNATYTTTAAGGDAYYCIAACDTPCAVAVMNHSNVVTLYTGQVSVGSINMIQGTYSISPNPNNGNFTLKGSGIQGNDPVQYDVVDVMGRVIVIGNILPRHGSVNEQVILPDVAAGRYMLRVYNGGAYQAFHIEVLR